jgi:hypothetical protein
MSHWRTPKLYSTHFSRCRSKQVSTCWYNAPAESCVLQCGTSPGGQRPQTPMCLHAHKAAPQCVQAHRTVYVCGCSSRTTWRTWVGAEQAPHGAALREDEVAHARAIHCCERLGGMDVAWDFGNANTAACLPFVPDMHRILQVVHLPLQLAGVQLHDRLRRATSNRSWLRHATGCAASDIFVCTTPHLRPGHHLPAHS